jgi:hypothetical protein
MNGSNRVAIVSLACVSITTLIIAGVAILHDKEVPSALWPLGATAVGALVGYLAAKREGTK